MRKYFNSAVPPRTQEFSSNHCLLYEEESNREPVRKKTFPNPFLATDINSTDSITGHKLLSLKHRYQVDDKVVLVGL